MKLSSRRECRIFIDDEVNARVEGLHPTDCDVMYNRYGMFAPNYFFNPKFKLGIWDGKIRFFQKSGKCLTYFVEAMIPELLKMKYMPEIIDNRKGPYVNPQPVNKDTFAHVINPKTGLPMELRYYQVEAVNALLEEGKGLISAATSSGKTTINAALVNTYGVLGMKTITIVPSTSLVIQTIADFTMLGLDVGEYTGRAKDLEHLHVVSTWQAIKNHPHLMKLFQVVVVDEVHQAKSKILNELVNVHGANIPYRFGLTGTIPKDEVEKLTIHTAFGDVKYTLPASTLMEEGFVSTVEVSIEQLFENHPDGYFPDYTAEKSYLTTRKERTEWIADRIIEKRSLPKGNSLVLVSSIAIGKKLQKLIPNSVFLYGADSADARKIVYDRFANEDDIVVIATVQIAGTGLSIDRIFHLFLIDIGKSFTRVIQAIGRSLRMGADKSHAYAYDICSNLKYSKRHLLTRVQYYKEAKYPFTRTVVKYRNYNDKFTGSSQDEIMAQLENDISLDY